MGAKTRNQKKLQARQQKPPHEGKRARNKKKQKNAELDSKVRAGIRNGTTGSFTVEEQRHYAAHYSGKGSVVLAVRRQRHR